MKLIALLQFSLALFLAGCGGKLNLTSPSQGASSGYLAGLIGSPEWNENNRTLTFSFYYVPPQNVTIVSMEGNFEGPTSGQVLLTYDFNTCNGQGTAVLPVNGTYKINVYVKDSSGKTTRVLDFSYSVSSSGGGSDGGGSGGGGGGGDYDTPPPPPF